MNFIIKKIALMAFVVLGIPGGHQPYAASLENQLEALEGFKKGASIMEKKQHIWRAAIEMAFYEETLENKALGLEYHGRILTNDEMNEHKERGKLITKRYKSIRQEIMDYTHKNIKSESMSQEARAYIERAINARNSSALKNNQ